MYAAFPRLLSRSAPPTATHGIRRRPDADLHHRHRRRRRRHHRLGPARPLDERADRRRHRELDAAIDAALADPAVKGIVITSAKPDFAGGMDLNVLAQHEGERRRRPGPRPLRRHHGAPPRCSGRSSAPAWTRRRSRAASRSPGPPPASPPASAPRSASPATAASWPTRRRPRIGLPEILLGIFPGAGGTTRLVRMLGVMAAAPILLEGKMLAARRREGRRPDRRGRAPRRPPPDRQGLGARRHRRRHRQALGRQGLQDARRRPLPPGGLHDLRRRLGDGPRQDPGRLSGGQGDALGDLRRRAGPLRHRAADRGPLVHPRADEPLLLRDDPLALPQQAGAGEGRRPPRPARPERAASSASSAPA